VFSRPIQDCCHLCVVAILREVYMEVSELRQRGQGLEGEVQQRWLLVRQLENCWVGQLRASAWDLAGRA